MKKYIGIDIGGMSIKGGLVTVDGKILDKYTVPTRVYEKSDDIVDDLQCVLDGLLSRNGLDISEISGVGIGSPGAIDPEFGIIKYSNNIKLENVKVKDELEERYDDISVFVDNDANCAALGEAKFGIGAGVTDLIFITLGTGVGSGFIINGKLFTGCAGGGAEAGHMVTHAGGELCTCGRRGCWEQYASASALIRQTEEAMKKNPETLMHNVAKEEGKISGKTAFIAGKAGDKVAKGVIKKYLGDVAEGLMNLANIFRPQMIIIGGGISHEGSAVLEPLQNALDTCLFGGKFNPEVAVNLASLGNDAGILGAAGLAMDNGDDYYEED